jgi:hypothetical protein
MSDDDVVSLEGEICTVRPFWTTIATSISGWIVACDLAYRTDAGSVGRKNHLEQGTIVEFCREQIRAVTLAKARRRGARHIDRAAAFDRFEAWIFEDVAPEPRWTVVAFLTEVDSYSLDIGDRWLSFYACPCLRGRCLGRWN